MITPTFPTTTEGSPTFTPIYWQRIQIMQFTNKSNLEHLRTMTEFNGDCGLHFTLSDKGLATNFFAEFGYRPFSNTSYGPIGTITPSEQRDLRFVFFRITGNGDGGSAKAEWYDDSISGLRTATITSPIDYANGQLRFNWRGIDGVGNLTLIKSNGTVVDLCLLAGVSTIDRTSITLGGTRAGNVTNFITSMHNLVTGQPETSAFLKDLVFHVGFQDLVHSSATTGQPQFTEFDPLLLRQYPSLSDLRVYTRLVSMSKLVEHSRQNIPHEEVVP